MALDDLLCREMSLILNTFCWISDSPGSLPPSAFGFHHWALARARGQTSHHQVSPSDRLPGLTFQAPLPESPHTHNANVLAAPIGSFSCDASEAQARLEKHLCSLTPHFMGSRRG